MTPMFVLDPIVRVIAATRTASSAVVPPEELVPDVRTLDSMRRKQQDIGSDAARLIECAGRTCYDSYGNGRSSKEYHEHIKEVQHGSVAEHASISFYLDNLSRGCTHELVRHRAGCAISQRSTRYVDESASPYVVHPLISKHVLNDPDAREAMEAAVVSARAAYTTVIAKLQPILETNGCDKTTARKQARGAARGFLGNALCTSLVWTANIRALRNCIEQRASAAADAEIRVLYNKIYNAANAVAPEWFDDYVKVDCADGVGFGLTTKYRKV